MWDTSEGCIPMVARPCSEAVASRTVKVGFIPPAEFALLLYQNQMWIVPTDFSLTFPEASDSFFLTNFSKYAMLCTESERKLLLDSEPWG